MTIGASKWIQYTERVVAEGHASYDDVANRHAKIDHEQDGHHKWCHLHENTVQTTGANEFLLYVKNDGTQTELYGRSESNGTEFQITKSDQVYIDDHTELTLVDGTRAFTGNVTIPDTTTSALGVILKGTDRFLHNYHHPTGDTQIPEGNNVFLGEDAGNFTMGSTATQTYHGSRNTFIGESIGKSNTTGYSNTFIGQVSGYSNTTGYFNTFVGRASGFTNDTGYQNTCIGYGAGYLLNEGHSNVFIGEGAGDAITTADECIIIGDYQFATDAVTNYQMRVGSLYGELSNGNLAIGAYGWGASATNCFTFAAGTLAAPPTGQLADKVTLYAKDVTTGRCCLYLQNEVGYSGVVVNVMTKADTGDYGTVWEGMTVINTNDNTIKMYADGGWRTLASGW